MLRWRVCTAARRGSLLLLLVAVLVVGGSASRASTAFSSSCRHQLVFDRYDGYACDVIVTQLSTDDGEGGEVALAMTSNDEQVPRNASALRLTLRRAAAPATALKAGRASSSTPLTHLPQLRSLEIDVSRTRSFPASLLSKLAAVSLLRLSVFRSASTDVAEYRLRLPTSADGTFATPNGSLSTLVLSDLGIEELPLKTFDGLTTLCFLLVDDNRLRSLPVGLFDDLCQLSSLSLSRNRFVDVDDMALVEVGRRRLVRCGRGLSRLRSLNLHGNQLRRLRAGAFRSVRSVVEINLSGNELSSIEAGAFSALSELRTLYIDTNRLVAVVPAMFDGLTSLTTLDVGYNRLADVASGAFRYLRALRTLRLYENEIQTIRPEAWTGLDELTELDLASNRVTAVDDSTFSQLCRLRQLDLSDNAVTAVSADAFVCLTELQWLRLSGNALSDGERQRLEAPQNAGTGRPASCDSCGNESATTTSAETTHGQSVYPVRASPPSSSATVGLGSAQILVVALTVGAAVALLFLTLFIALYVCLRRRRRAVLDCSATSSYSPQSGITCSLDNSVHGWYVRFHPDT